MLRIIDHSFISVQRIERQTEKRERRAANEAKFGLLVSFFCFRIEIPESSG